MPYRSTLGKGLYYDSCTEKHAGTGGLHARRIGHRHDHHRPADRRRPERPSPVDAATSTFKDMYSALPGDIALATTRLPNCAACTNGDGNGVIAQTPATAPTAGNEAGNYFVHLAAADLITGITSNGAVTVWGNLLPAGKIGGGLQPGSTTGVNADFTNLVNGATIAPTAGLYMTLTQTAGAAPVVTITPNQAQRLDTKIDDGSPGSGSVRAGGSVGVGAADCAASVTLYNETQSGINCITYVRIQG
jgi:hypothetical protein